ncbi:MAG: phospholipase A [Pseudohongiella sp.]|nr:phospholipase A [Pseudohongiella sp.]
MPIARLLLTLSAIIYLSQSFAASSDSCLLEQLRLPANDTLTVIEVKNYCLEQEEEAIESPLLRKAAEIIDRGQTVPQARFNNFFEPYKQSLFMVGNMKNRDSSDPFSGKTLDIKFELGLKFQLFPQREGFERLAPLYFGYSQKSWWDIAEASAPFKEHNFNPEIFWDYLQAKNRNGINFPGRFIDQFGYEHQSNGRSGIYSRSWDRLYVKREFKLSDKFSLDVKAWRIVGLGQDNSDIDNYLGNAQLKAKFKPNDRLSVNLSTIKGLDTSKYSYQLDLIYSMPNWVNSDFIISYYDGYGESLISYKQKSRSIRAGFYFPVSFNNQ